MAISETNLETWSHIGSQTQSASTYQAIKEVLESSDAPFSHRGFEVYLQGSYGNNTNIRGSESDVDVVVCLTDAFIADTSNLNPTELAIYEANRSPASYGYSEFKSEVLSWLRMNFGHGVEPGRKAISVPGGGNRREADVVACIRHRRYTSYSSPSKNQNRLGITFKAADGEWIKNFPKQHRENCTKKHQATDGSFKPAVRVLKNIRNSMLKDGFLGKGVAPSYFLEGLLWNIPDIHFEGSFQKIIDDGIYWLEHCNPTDLTSASGLHWLVRDGSSVCWHSNDYREFVTALRRYWNSGH